MKTLLLFALMLALAPMAPASAATLFHNTGRLELVSVPVQDGDLDVTLAADQARLADRFDRAMRLICGDRPMSRQIPETLQYKNCKKTLTLDAQAQMDPDRNAAFNVALSRLW